MNSYRNSPPDAQHARRALLETLNLPASNRRSAGVPHQSQGADLKTAEWIDDEEGTSNAAHHGSTRSGGCFDLSEFEKPAYVAPLEPAAPR
jgi:hypothetical protein